MRYAYPADVEQEAGDGFTATFGGLPGATDGHTREEALARAQDLLVTALATLAENGTPLPAPPAAHGRPMVAVPALEAAKLALHEVMQSAGVGNIELAHPLGVDEKAARRLRDPLDRSHIGQVEAALRCLGKRLDITARDAA